MNNSHRPLLGVSLILVSCLTLASHDGLSKYLTQLYPVFLVIWARYMAQTALMLTLFTPRMGRRVFHTLRPKLQICRGLSLVSVSMLFISGLSYIPLAEATAQSRRDGLRIARLRLDNGVTSALPYRQAETLLTQAEQQLASEQLALIAP